MTSGKIITCLEEESRDDREECGRIGEAIRNWEREAVTAGRGVAGLLANNHEEFRETVTVTHPDNAVTRMRYCILISLLIQDRMPNLPRC